MSDITQSKNPYHPDIVLFLIIIPFISAFNYYLTYSTIQLSWYLLLTFSLDTLQGYAAWWAVRSCILYLDKLWPYEKNLKKRIAIQLISTTLIGLMVISVLTEIVSLIARGRFVPIHFYTHDLLIISIWFFVINGIYAGLYYYNKLQQLESTRRKENRAKNQGVIVRQGNSDVKLLFDELAGFSVDGDYVMVCHQSEKKYYHDQSLTRLEENLPGDIFFRLNRQFILHRRYISGFSRIENGKLKVFLHDYKYFPQEVTVSRTRASEFKKWFRPN